MIELPAQGAAERLDARRLPMGEIGEGAVFDFTVLAVGLAKENGGRGVAVGDGGDVHVDLIQLQISLVKEIINNYMSTNPTKKEIQLQHQSRLTQNLGEEDPSDDGKRGYKAQDGECQTARQFLNKRNTWPDRANAEF